jgi:hypothetical protein
MMALGTAEQVNTFLLGGYQLQAMAPEEFRTGVTATFKFFYYKKGPVIVQKGRVTPDPITLSFKFKGPDAVDAELFLRAMAKKQEKISLSWLNRFAFKGYITQVGDFSHTRLWATGSITFQPTEDTSQAGSGAALSAKFATSSLPAQNWLDLLGSASIAIAGFLVALKQQVADVFQPLVDAKAAIDLVTLTITQSIATAGDIASLPYQTASALASSINDALLLIPIAASDLSSKVLAPAIPIFEGATNYLGQAAGLGVLVELDNAQDAFLNLASTLAPQPVIYKSVYGDTLQDVCDIFKLALVDLLSLNSTLTDGPIPAGTLVKIPAVSI